MGERNKWIKLIDISLLNAIETSREIGREPFLSGKLGELTDTNSKTCKKGTYGLKRVGMWTRNQRGKGGRGRGKKDEEQHHAVDFWSNFHYFNI